MPNLKLALRILVAAAILIVLFQIVPFSDVVNGMAKANSWWVGAGFAIMIVERIVAAGRLKILTDRLQMPFSVLGLCEISAIASFYSLFLPGDLAGGGVRWYHMSKPSGQGAQAFAALLFERLIDTLILVLFGLIFWVWDDPPFGAPLLDISLFVILGGLVFAMAAVLSPRTSKLSEKAIALIPFTRVRKFMSEKTRKVLVSVQTFRGLSNSAMAGLVVLSVLRHLLSILIILCFAQALAIAVGFSTIGWIRSFMNIITMLPIAFAGLGVREASFSLLLEPYGVAAASAIALSLFTFFTHVFLAVIGGLLQLRRVILPGRIPALDGSTPTADSSTKT